MKKVFLFSLVLSAFSLSAATVTFTDYVKGDFTNISGQMSPKADAFKAETPEVAKCLADRYTVLSKEINMSKKSNVKAYCDAVIAKKDVSTIKGVKKNYVYKGNTFPSIFILGEVKKEPASCKAKGLKLAGDNLNKGKYWFLGSTECPTVDFTK